ncbi:hypothetical protein ACGFJC_08120 [Nonomuraea fuscirosea]|uniref:hypothetical protein n=1 Tax=Nonomuraea fuscirosea TaxID=1291556 RepID=UPI00346F1237
MDRAAKRGLVRRTRSSRDRRACLIELTGEGQRMGELAHEGVAARLETLAGDLPAGHRDLLASAVETLLSRHTAGPPRA